MTGTPTTTTVPADGIVAGAKVLYSGPLSTQARATWISRMERPSVVEWAEPGDGPGRAVTAVDWNGDTYHARADSLMLAERVVDESNDDVVRIPVSADHAAYLAHLNRRFAEATADGRTAFAVVHEISTDAVHGYPSLNAGHARTLESDDQVAVEYAWEIAEESADGQRATVVELRKTVWSDHREAKRRQPLWVETVARFRRDAVPAQVRDLALLLV
jgi:hypothetical protein